MKPIIRSAKALKQLIREKEAEMHSAADNLEFELAAILRDEINSLEERLKGDSKKGSKGKAKANKKTTTELVPDSSRSSVRHPGRDGFVKK